MSAGVIDAWVNVRVTGHGWQEQVGHALRAELQDSSAEDLLARMDALGVDQAIIGVNGDVPEKAVLAMADAHPDRLALAAHVDPRRGARGARALETLARAHRVVAVRLLPCLIELPASDRVHHPLYEKASALGLPVCVTTGTPPSPLRADCQDPSALDAVCREFPNLVVVMAHGAAPWWDSAIRLMEEHPRLHLMTSAWAPSRLPPPLVQFMSGPGQDKVMFATDFPFLPMERCVAEARALALSAAVRDKYLRGNAARIFFG